MNQSNSVAGCREGKGRVRRLAVEQLCQCGELACEMASNSTRNRHTSPDDATTWMQQVKRAEESVRAWLVSLETGTTIAR